MVRGTLKQNKYLFYTKTAGLSDRSTRLRQTFDKPVRPQSHWSGEASGSGQGSIS